MPKGTGKPSRPSRAMKTSRDRPNAGACGKKIGAQYCKEHKDLLPACKNCKPARDSQPPPAAVISASEVSSGSWSWQSSRDYF